MLRRLQRECDGQDVVEYALLTAFIGLAGLLAFRLIVVALGGAYASWDGGVQGLWEPRDPGSGGNP